MSQISDEVKRAAQECLAENDPVNVALKIMVERTAEGTAIGGIAGASAVGIGVVPGFIVGGIAGAAVGIPEGLIKGYQSISHPDPICVIENLSGPLDTPDSTNILPRER